MNDTKSVEQKPKTKKKEATMNEHKTAAGPGETIKLASEMVDKHGFTDDLVNDFRPAGGLRDLDDIDYYCTLGAVITMANEIESLVEKGFVVIGPAEYIENDEVDEVIRNGRQAALIVKGLTNGFSLIELSVYVNTEGVLADEVEDLFFIDDHLVHPSEVGIHPKKRSKFKGNV